MRGAHITRCRAVMLAGVLLLGPLLPLAGAQAESAPWPSILPSSTQTSEGPWLGDFVEAVLVYGAILLVGCTLGGGLLLGGIAAFERWCDRRKEGADRHRVRGERPLAGCGTESPEGDPRKESFSNLVGR